MIVEDNPITRRLVQYAFEGQGIGVVTVTTPSEALASFAAHPTKLVLQDVAITDSSMNLVGQLRALPGGLDVPILAFAGMLSKREEARLTAAGFDDLISKPIEPARLLQIVRSHLPGDLIQPPVSPVRRRLVLADDDPVQRKLVAYRLKKAGYEVVATADGNEALARIRESRPDVVVSDVLMPGLDGFGLCVAVRNDPTLATLPVLLITNSYLETADRELARRAGAFDLMVRTPELRDVIDVLATIVDDARSGPPLILPAPIAVLDPEIERVRNQRAMKQLERQLALNNAANQRCTSLAAELSVLRAISEAVIAHAEPEPVLRRILDICLDAGGIASGCLYLVEDARTLHSGAGTNAEFFDEPSLLHSVIATQKTLRVPSSEVRADVAADLLARAGATALLAVPLQQHQKTVGALFMASHSAELVSEDRVTFAEAVAGQISLALSLTQAFDATRRSEETARSQAALLASVFEHMADGVIAASADGVITHHNRAAAAILPDSRDAIDGWTEREVFGPDLAPIHASSLPLNRALAGQAVDRGEFLVRATDGTERSWWLSVDARPLGNGGAVAVFRDTTFERAARARLLASEERYRSLFDNSPLPMWTYDRTSLRFVTVNDAALEHYGYTRDEFAAMTIADIRPPEEIAVMQANLATPPREIASRAWRHRKKDGTLITVETDVSDYVGEGRNVRLVVVTDVTERERTRETLRKTEEQLRQAQKLDAIGRLAGGVAHDFNNVLSVIGGYATFLAEALDPTDQRHEDAVHIRRAAERATGITRQLLTLSRHGIVQPRSLDLDATVTGFVPMLRRLAGEHVRLDVRRAVVPSVIADPGQIEQVLMNLAVNARDAMPDGGRLTIELETTTVDVEGAASKGYGPGTFVTLAVTDTGTGMPAEIQDKIFDPFFTTKDAAHGTGLGLSIVHGIVTQAGGHVRVHSVVGHGTTFRLHFPASNEVVETVEQAASEPPVVLPAVTVLVVDQDADVRAVAARVLASAGCRTLEAATAADAQRLCVAHEGDIDVVLLDAIVADGGADRLVEQLRELRPKLRAVMMSGYPAGALTKVGGVRQDLLVKPFTPRELRRAVGRVLDVTRDGQVGAVAETQRARRGRVLLVDDDDAVRTALGRLLRRSDLDIVEARDGEQAIAEVEKRQDLDVIITDVHMPRMTGLDLLRAVRRVDLDVPVIMMSGSPSVEAAAAAVEHGAFRYLMKPFNNDDLLKHVRHAVRGHALARIRREAYEVGGAGVGAVDRMGLEVRYEQAVEGLYMAFQPIIHAHDGLPFGVEALMRSTEVSLPSPDTVLAAAATLGRLSHLGRKIRRLSAAAVADRTDGLALFVNLHPDDLFDVELIEEDAPLTKIAHRVVLEVTERASLALSPALSERLARLRTLGFRIAVDDIGSGYSGLTSFTELDPEIVKLDMSIVRDVHTSTLKQRTIRALCGLCHEGGCLVVGEGVETLDERTCLTSLGCDLLQGYQIARPDRRITV